MKMWKVYDNNDDNDDGQRTNFDQKSSLEPSAQDQVLLKVVNPNVDVNVDVDVTYMDFAFY